VVLLESGPAYKKHCPPDIRALIWQHQVELERADALVLEHAFPN
jgi:hypothetical protein